ncbi:MAG: GNAT family N-acetyltransferase [Ginsengibacter sp.]
MTKEKQTASTGFIIRRAKSHDCEAMMQLIRELAEYEKAPQEVTVTFDHFVESGFGQNPVWWAFVAEIDEKVVGLALYYIRYSTWKGQRLYLEDILVNEPWRGKGIGKLLFDKLIEETKLKGLSGMHWQVLDWNKPAINFYEKYKGVKLDNEWVNCALNVSPENLGTDKN